MTGPEDALVEQICYEHRARLDRWMPLRTRRSEIRALIENAWRNVWPDELETDELPMTANIFRTTTEDLGRLFAEQLPSERRYPSSPDDEEDAEKCERVLGSYSWSSEVFDYLEYYGQDMVAAGYTAIKTWPDFGVPAEKRTPTFRRLDPLKTLPELVWEPDKPTDNVIVHYAETIDRLRRQFPEQAQLLLEKIGDSRVAMLQSSGYDLAVMDRRMREAMPVKPGIEIIDYYSSKAVVRVAYYFDPQRGEQAEPYGVLLNAMANETGICPVQFAPRPTWSSEPIGQLDDSKGMVLARNRYWRMLLDYFIRMVYGGKLVWNVKNPQQIGPDTRYYALGPDARMDPVTPEVPSFQSLSILEQLDNEARGSAIAPKSREGDIDLNKATAEYLTKAQGQYTSVIRSLQRNFAIAKRRSNEAAFAQDEAYCNVQKKVFGMARGKRYALTYTPRTLIRGDYSNHVTYGTSSGIDAPTQNVMNLQKRQVGGRSLETFLEQDPDIDDPAMEQSRIHEEAIDQALLQGLMLPNTPVADRLRAAKAFHAGKDIEAVIEELTRAAPVGTELTANGQPTVPAGPSGTPGAEAPATPLPPLAALRGR